MTMETEAQMHDTESTGKETPKAAHTIKKDHGIVIDSYAREGRTGPYYEIRHFRWYKNA